MTTNADFGLSRIGQISVRAKDLAASVAFYRDQLGIPFLFEAPPKMAFFQCGEVRLLVGEPEAEFDHPSSVLYFRVDDVAAAYEALKGRGVEFKDEPHLVHKAEGYELWMTFFTDPAGNTLALMSEKR
ncbi:MAG TPA: VOC family protein [Thermoanaerobaculia bacterium]|jgi:methylmalonyl-CoA/ethylmalonyl-CoA epimerase